MSVWLLLDGRAKLGDSDAALVLDTADSEAEARNEGKTTWAFYDAIWMDPDGELRHDVPPCVD